MDVLDVLDTLTGGRSAALVILAFLQTECRTTEYSQELYSQELLTLVQEIDHTRFVDGSGLSPNSLDDGDIETDGHLSSCIAISLGDIQPAVEPQRPGNHADAAALHQVAEELKEIAAQLEHNVVAQATQNLSRKILTSPSEEWKDHLTWEVDRVMRQGVSLRDLPQERVIVALTLTLVKGVCEQAPRLLRNLFNITLQYLGPARAR